LGFTEDHLRFGAVKEKHFAVNLAMESTAGKKLLV